MDLTREQRLEGVKFYVEAALPYAKVYRNRKKPTSIDPGGNVIVYDGDPGEPETLMSPLTYTYDHQVPVSVATHPSATAAAGTSLEGLLLALQAMVEADRTLGGLCEFAEWRAPDPQDAEVPGVEPVRWAEPILVLTYTTRNALV